MSPNALVRLDVDRFRLELRRRRLTQKKIASVAGIDSGTLSRACNGRPMRAWKLDQLAVALAAYPIIEISPLAAALVAPYEKLPRRELVERQPAGRA